MERAGFLFHSFPLVLWPDAKAPTRFLEGSSSFCSSHCQTGFQLETEARGWQASQQPPKAQLQQWHHAACLADMALVGCWGCVGSSCKPVTVLPTCSRKEPGGHLSLLSTFVLDDLHIHMHTLIVMVEGSRQLTPVGQMTLSMP